MYVHKSLGTVIGIHIENQIAASSLFRLQFENCATAPGCSVEVGLIAQGVPLKKSSYHSLSVAFFCGWNVLRVFVFK